MNHPIDPELPGNSPVVPQSDGQDPPSLPPPDGYQRTSTHAVTSMVLGIVGWLICGLFTAVPAVIFGHLGLHEIARKPHLEGRGMAIAGLIMGYVHIAGTLGIIAILVIYLALGGWKQVAEDWENASCPSYEIPGNAECLPLPQEFPFSQDRISWSAPNLA